MTNGHPGIHINRHSVASVFLQCSCSQNDEFLSFPSRSASGHFGNPCTPCVTNHNGTNRYLLYSYVFLLGLPWLFEPRAFSVCSNEPCCLHASLSALLPACLSFSPAARLPLSQPGGLSACCKTLGARRELCFSMLLLPNPSARRLNYDFNRRRADC